MYKGMDKTIDNTKVVAPSTIKESREVVELKSGPTRWRQWWRLSMTVPPGLGAISESAV